MKKSIYLALLLILISLAYSSCSTCKYGCPAKITEVDTLQKVEKRSATKYEVIAE